MQHTEILKKVIGALGAKLPAAGGSIVIDGEHAPVEISKQNFHPIKLAVPNSKIAFIDGGNAELVAAPNFSVHFVRVTCCRFDKNKRAESRQQAFYVLATANGGEGKAGSGKIQYIAETFGDNVLGGSLCFDADDETLKEGKKGFSISKLGGIARRFAELKLAAELCKTLEAGSVIVLDGTLEAVMTGEAKYLDALFDLALKKNILVTAFAKTTTMLSDTGSSFCAALQELSPEGCWFYHPVTEIKSSSYRAELFFAKLHPNSEHVFRIELYKKQKDIADFGKLFGMLAANSRDISFPGYPYGLIITDRLARVSNREREHIAMQLRMLAGKDFARLKRYICSINAHSVLDTM